MSARDPDALTPEIREAWFIVAPAAAVGDRPRGFDLWGRPYVVWRDGGGVARVFEDWCPHRAVPLHEGTVRNGQLQCRYHGWRFDGAGRCVAVPGLDGAASGPGRAATVLPTVEQQGFVWVWAHPDVPPRGAPYRFPHADDPDYLVVRTSMVADGTMHQVIENALDVPHTAYLHGGLFRHADTPRRPVACRIERHRDRAECWFEGEAVPTGLAGRILAPGGGEITHVDRFVLPSITEVVYRLGDDAHLVLNGACTPIGPNRTVMHAVVQVRSRLPRWLVRPVFEPVARRIFRQDEDILSAQTRNHRRFGEARWTNTEVDVLGGQILRLMRQAARGERPEASEPHVQHLTMWV